MKQVADISSQNLSCCLPFTPRSSTLLFNLSRQPKRLRRCSSTSSQRGARLLHLLRDPKTDRNPLGCERTLQPKPQTAPPANTAGCCRQRYLDPKAKLSAFIANCNRDQTHLGENGSFLDQLLTVED